jgi:hypothetical protein
MSITGAIGIKPFKIAIFLFFIFIVLSSDVFIDRMLANNPSYVEGRHVTSSGAVAQGMLLSICYIIIHVLVTCDFI